MGGCGNWGLVVGVWVHQRFVISPPPFTCPAMRLLICIYMHTNALCCSCGIYIYIYTYKYIRLYVCVLFFASGVAAVACGAVVNVAHVVYVTFLIPTLQRRTFSTINAHLSYTCINCRPAKTCQTRSQTRLLPLAIAELGLRQEQ